MEDLKIWQLDTLKPEVSFTCFEIADKEDRLRIEEGLIALLNNGKDFKPGDLQKEIGRSEILHITPSGWSSTLEIRYYLK